MIFTSGRRARAAGDLATRIEVNDLNAEFARTLSLLRQEKGVSQRAAAAELGISQALMSHYENGIREPDCLLWSRPVIIMECPPITCWAAP